MALQYIGLSGYRRGIASEEAGINCSKFSVEVEPEINDWLPGIDGQATGKAVGDPMGKLSIEGEIKATTGLMAATFVAAFVPANETEYFGRDSGGWYLDRGTIDDERDGWHKASTEFSSKYNVD